MSKSYQLEVPEARINITLDVDTHGEQKQTELPLRLLVLGAFSDAAEATNIAGREKINMSSNNLDQVMERLLPTADFDVPNNIQKTQDRLPVHLAFRCLQDFSPERVVMQIPVLRKLLAMRHLLRELKAHILDDQALKNILEKILRNPETIKALHAELQPFILGE